MTYISGLTYETILKSEEGAKKIAPFLLTCREQVFSVIAESGDEGKTDRELQRELKMKGNTQRPRRIELWLTNRICLKRDAEGNPVYRTEGKHVKSLIWIVGAEKRCECCGHAYTKSFDRTTSKKT